MNHRRRLAAVSVNTLVLAVLLAGCGGYESPSDDSSTGGSAAEPGTGGAAASGTGGGTGGVDGGTGGAVGCTSVTPCGGDLVGTWNVTSSCLDVSGQIDLTLVGMNCVTDSVTGSLTVTGAWTDNGDGTYTDATQTTGSHHMELGEPCTHLSGTIIGCDSMVIPMTSMGYSEVTCVDNTATGGCTCDATINQIGAPDSGGIGFAPAQVRPTSSHTAADNVLTLGQGASEAILSYCVSGTTLSVTPQSAGRTGTVTGSVELQRQ